MTAKKVLMFGLSAMPVVKFGDDISDLILDSLEKDGVAIEHGSVIVIAQKIISIAENAVQYLRDITPSPEALRLSQQTGRDERL